DDGEQQDRDSGGKGKKRGPGARAGRRDYSDLPRFEMFWDFPEGGYCCPRCARPFTVLGDHVSGEQLDWQVIVRVLVHCRRRYKRGCSCRVPVTMMAPGPPKAIGKGLFSHAFIAMLFTERYVAGRSMNSLVTGLARQGADISPATLRRNSDLDHVCGSVPAEPGHGCAGMVKGLPAGGGCGQAGCRR